MFSYSEILTIIPARGGSKRVKGKNKKKLAGYPLFVWSLKEALWAGIPRQNIIVTSEDFEILDITQHYGCVAHSRPLELCQDHCSTDSALLDVLQSYPDRVKDCKYVLDLGPTNPIRFSRLIPDCLNTLDAGNFDCLITAWQNHNFLAWEDNGQWTFNIPLCNGPRTQEVKQPFLFNSTVHCFRPQVLLETGCSTNSNIHIFGTSFLEQLDIDTPEDFQQAEWILTGNLLNQIRPPEYIHHSESYGV